MVVVVGGGERPSPPNVSTKVSEQTRLIKEELVQIPQQSFKVVQQVGSSRGQLEVVVFAPGTELHLAS